MYEEGSGNDKEGKDAGNRTLCPYRNFSQAIKHHPARWIQLLNKIKNVCRPKLFQNFRKNLGSDKTRENVFGKTRQKVFSAKFSLIFGIILGKN